MRLGETSEALFIAREGQFETTISLDRFNGTPGQSRLATFSPGMCFGEIGFVAQTPRTADIIATRPGECWVLHRSDFEALSASHPDVVIALLKALTCDIGAKLSQTSIQLTLMEHY